MGCFNHLIKVLRENVYTKEIAEWREIDLHSKKLNLNKHVELMIWSVMEDCEKLR